MNDVESLRARVAALELRLGAVEQVRGKLESIPETTLAQVDLRLANRNLDSLRVRTNQYRGTLWTLGVFLVERIVETLVKGHL